MEHRYQRPPSPGFRPPSPRNASLQRPSSSAGLSGGQPSSLPTGGFHSGALRRYSGVGIGGPPSAATNDWSASTRRVSSPYDSSTSFGIQQQQSRIVQPSSHPAQLPARRSSISTTAGRAPALPYARPSHGRSTSFSQSPPAMAHLSLHDPYSPTFDTAEEDESERRRRPKTPPDCCSVCGSTSTPEWRKGPSGIRELCNGCGLMAAKRAKERTAAGFEHPSTIANIVRELQGIGEERFKAPAGTYALPANTPARIMATQARTREQENRSAMARPRAPKGKSSASASEREAAESLIGFSRRVSISQQSPPGPPTSFGGRRGSIPSGQAATIYSAPRGRRLSSSGGMFQPPTLFPPSASHSSQAFAYRPPSPVRPPSPMQSSFSVPRRPPSPVRPRTPTSVGSQSTNRMGLGFLTHTSSPGAVTPTWGASNLSGSGPSPNGVRQRRMSLTEVQAALAERRRTQQYQ